MEGTCSQFGTRVIHSFQLIYRNMTLKVLQRFISELVFKLYQEFHVVEGGTFSCNFDYTKLHVLLSYCTHETHNNIAGHKTFTHSAEWMAKACRM